MSNIRLARIGEQIKAELSDLFLREMKDPRIGFVSITDVEVTPDLRHATVYVSVLGNEQAAEDTLAGLQSAKGFLRGEIGKRIRLRYTPEFHFKLDKSIERGVRISALLREIERGEEDGGERPADSNREDSAPK